VLILSHFFIVTDKKARAFVTGKISRCFTISVDLAEKSSPWTNTLAYLYEAKEEDKKCLIIMTSWGCIKHFTALIGSVT
jgi:hypothetical protein